MMMATSRDRMDGSTEAIPVFLTIVMMPLAVSITDGIAFGFVSVCGPEAATRHDGGKRTRSFSTLQRCSSFVTHCPMR